MSKLTSAAKTKFDSYLMQSMRLDYKKIELMHNTMIGSAVNEKDKQCVIIETQDQYEELIFTYLKRDIPNSLEEFFYNYVIKVANTYLDLTKRLNISIAESNKSYLAADHLNMSIKFYQKIYQKLPEKYQDLKMQVGGLVTELKFDYANEIKKYADKFNSTSDKSKALKITIVQIYEQSLKAFKRIYNEQSKIIDERCKVAIAKIYSEIAVLYYEIDDYDKEIQYYKIAFKNYTHIKNYNEAAEISAVLGNIYYNKFKEEDISNITNLAEAINYLQFAYNAYIHVNVNEKQKADLSYALGVCYNKHGNIEKAIKYYEIAQAKYQSTGKQKMFFLICKELDSLFKETSNHLKLLENHEKIAAYYESLNNLDQSKNAYYHQLLKEYEFLYNLSDNDEKKESYLAKGQSIFDRSVKDFFEEELSYEVSPEEDVEYLMEISKKLKEFPKIFASEYLAEIERRLEGYQSGDIYDTSSSDPDVKMIDLLSPDDFRNDDVLTSGDEVDSI